MIRASILLALAWQASRLLKNRPAAQRHLLWIASLATASVLPFLTWIVPAWRPDVAARVIAALPRLMETSAVQTARQTSGTIVHAVGIEPEGKMAVILFSIWIAGSLIALFLLLPGVRAIRELANRAHAATDPELLQTTNNLALALGIRRPVRLLVHAGNSLPLTWGTFRPKVLLPEEAPEWSAGRRHAVLTHELAHIKRHDWFLQMLAEVVCAIYWFNPLFWIARNNLHLESERACDDAVLNLGLDGKDYAQHLLDIARGLKRREPAWSLAMAGQVHLERRLVAVLDPTLSRKPMTWITAIRVLLPLLCVVLPVAAMRAPVVKSGPLQVIRYTTPPLYSDEARRLGIEGVVKVEALIDGDGHPHNLSVVQGLGGYGLDQNALIAVRGWQFAPGRPGVTNIDVEFNLRNAELNEMIANDMVEAEGPDVIPPRIIHRVEPVSPMPQAGAVLLDVVIQEDGVPKVLRVIRSLSWSLDEPAITALEQWRFSPAERDHSPVKVRMNIEIQLDKNSSEAIRRRHVD